MDSRFRDNDDKCKDKAKEETYMIISASRRTDIPAFFADWFMNRVRAGSVEVRNPFNKAQASRVSLFPVDVDAIVFWTKNPAPLMKHLDELDSMGYKYYFLYTLNGYPALLEPRVPSCEDSVSTFRALSGRLGAGRVIWRYDPIIITDATPEEYIVSNFTRLAGQLEGAAKRVTFSFAVIDGYRKVIANMERFSREHGMKFEDITGKPDVVRRLASAIADIARRHSMDIYSCADPNDLSAYGIRHGKCIDDGLIRELFGIEVGHGKDKNQRSACGCVQSRDIGQYNTCLHGCVYCYATSGALEAVANYQRHDPMAPSMLP